MIYHITGTMIKLCYDYISMIYHIASTMINFCYNYISMIYHIASTMINTDIILFQWSITLLVPW